MKFKRITIGSILLAASSLLSRLLGVIRDSVFAKQFGAASLEASMDINAYFAAFKIPDFIYTLMIFGAVSAAFLPIYTKLKLKKQEEADFFANQIINTVLILSVAFSGLSFLFAPILVPLLVPGFTVEATEVCVELTRIMLLSPILFGLSSIFQGIENSHKRYLGIAMAPIVYNLSIIVAALFFSETHGVYALAWGVVAGALFHLLVQLPGAIRCGYRYQLTKQLISKDSIQFMRLSLPRILGLGFSQVSTLIDTFIASLMAAGSLAILTYSTNFQSLAYGVVGISVSIAAFAHLAEEGQKENKDDFISTLKKSCESILFWVIPAIVGLFLLNQEIVAWILERGAFSAEASRLTALTFSIFIWGALGQSLIPLYGRAFYALEDTKTPVLIALFSVTLNIACSLILTQAFNFEIWALGISALMSNTLNAILLIAFLKRKISAKSLFPFKAFMRNSIIAAVMSLSLLLLKELEISNSLLQIALLSSGGAVVYIGIHKLNRTSLI